MRKVIHHMRRQSEEVRRHILHVIIMIAAAILLLLWIYSLGVNLTDSDTQTRARQDLEPFSTFKNSAMGEYQTISDSP
ncbi:MAG: hypothetical protein WD963_01395 [Candidatus Paceibacterota bacterium]